MATGVWLWPAHTITLAAPWPGEVIRDGDAVTVRGEDYVVSVTDCVAVSGDRVEAGAPFATIDEDRWATVSVRPIDAPAAPAFSSPDLAAGWLAVTRDPRPLLGLRPH